MTEAIALRLGTIAPSSDFLVTLAQLVLRGYPRADDATGIPLDLHTWTILVPTRRAARRLQQILLKESDRKTLLLPRISPIGDLDEDLTLASLERGDLPPALSPQARLFAMVGFIAEWANLNSHLQLAQDLRGNGGQAQALARSLGQLLDHVEEEGLELNSLTALYDIDLAFHREAVLSLLDLLRVKLPGFLHDKGLIDARVRRNRLISLEAARISAAANHGPIIVAGSTGTIAATRTLLCAIAKHPNGAVILPGLDLDMDGDDWAAVDGQHPQFAMKRLLENMSAVRADVARLTAQDSARSWLVREALRSSETADMWQQKLRGQQAKAGLALAGVKLIAAVDRHEEANAIALLLRHTAEETKLSAALITPDRELARLVKVALARWHMTIDDTAGEPLIRFEGASLLALIMDCVKARFSAQSLVALFSHQDCQSGFSRPDFQRIAAHFEIVVLRQYTLSGGLAGISTGLERIRLARAAGHRLPRAAMLLSEEDWHDLSKFVAQLTAHFEPLTRDHISSLPAHLSALQNTLAALAPALDWELAENHHLRTVLDGLSTDGVFFPLSSFAMAAEAIDQSLRSEIFRPPGEANPRLVIMGLLEARLMRPDVAILGGLNEGRWPAQPDPGPWLNRSMRKELGLQQPEREIGQTAHDFVQAFGNTQVYLTWSLRIDNAPAIPSRWILRLRMILQSMDMALDAQLDTDWTNIAACLDRPERVVAGPKPLPLPPLALRPKHFSVTEVERLIRDPYGVYAKRILALEPLEALGQVPDAALRGQLFHFAIGQWNEAGPYHSVSDSEAALVAAGATVFKPFAGDRDVATFWWPRFVRMAQWLATHEAGFRKNTEHHFSEIKGRLAFLIKDEEYSLSARADRLDLLANGTLRVIDYKTGEVPSAKQMKSGLSAQLTLQAAMAASGAFEDVPATPATELVYIKISGGEPAGEILRPAQSGNDAIDVMATAFEHLARFKALLTIYHDETIAYIPRAALEEEEQATDFDHLSRYLEWR